MYSPITYSAPVYQANSGLKNMTKSLVANQQQMNRTMKPLYNFHQIDKQLAKEKETRNFTPIKIKIPSQNTTPSTNYQYSDQKDSQRYQIYKANFALPDSGQKIYNQHSPFHRQQHQTVLSQTIPSQAIPQQQSIPQQFYQLNFQARDISPARILFKSGYDYQEGIKKQKIENKNLNEKLDTLKTKLKNVSEYHDQYLELNQMKEKIEQFQKQYKQLLTQNDILMKDLEFLQNEVTEAEKGLELKDRKNSQDDLEQQQDNQEIRNQDDVHEDINNNEQENYEEQEQQQEQE